MFNEAVRRGSWTLRHVLDWLVTQRQMKIWHDDAYYCNDNEMIECNDEYEKRKVQKASIKEEFMPITWYQSRYCTWCMSKDEKRDAEALWA